MSKADKFKLFKAVLLAFNIVAALALVFFAMYEVFS